MFKVHYMTMLNVFKVNIKSSREVFFKKGVLKNFPKFTGNTCARAFCQQLYLKETLAQVFSCEFCEIFRNTFFCRTPVVAAFVSECSYPCKRQSYKMAKHTQAIRQQIADEL